MPYVDIMIVLLLHLNHFIIWFIFNKKKYILFVFNFPNKIIKYKKYISDPIIAWFISYYFVDLLPNILTNTKQKKKKQNVRFNFLSIFFCIYSMSPQHHELIGQIQKMEKTLTFSHVSIILSLKPIISYQWRHVSYLPVGRNFNMNINISQLVNIYNIALPRKSLVLSIYKISMNLSNMCS